MKNCFNNTAFNKSNLRKNLLKKLENYNNHNNSYNNQLLFTNFKKLWQQYFLTPSLASTTRKGLVVAGFYPNKHEVNILPILNWLQTLKYTIALPKVKPNRRILDFYSWDLSNNLTKNQYNIYESTSQHILIPNVVIVPLVGFDKYGYRLGYGCGYYDATLSNLQQHKIITIGLAFSWQEIDKIPYESFDVKLNIILTEKDIYLTNME